MRVTLDVITLNKIMAYLGERPFREVAPLIKAVHEDVKEIQEPTPDIKCVNLSAEKI